MNHLTKYFYCCLMVFLCAVNLYADQQSSDGHFYDPFKTWISCLARQNCTLIHNDVGVLTFSPGYYSSISNLIERAKKQKKKLKYQCQQKELLNRLIVSDRPVEFKFSKIQAKNIIFQRNSHWPFSLDKKYHVISDGITIEIWLPEQVYRIIEQNRYDDSVFLINLDALFDADTYRGYLSLSDVIKVHKSELQSY